jgi:N-methylhydantoinase A/oxoprolinase/acetone carboxylase beta subunit
MFVGTDVGGTFTDYIIIDSVEIRAFKALTTTDPSLGIIENLKNHDKHNIIEFSHGTTVAVNAVLERKGVDIIFFTTKGFKDLVRIGRQARNNVYSFNCEKPHLPIKKTIEISERIDAQGSILTKVSTDELERVCDEFTNKSPVAVIGFLNSYINPENELIAERILKDHFPLVISSHKIRCEIREFERFSSAIIEGYCAPLVNDYLKRLGSISDQFFIMQSNGGRCRPQYLNKINLLFSGPAGGVAASQRLCMKLGIDNAILYDMGGTSVDISAIVNGSPLYTDNLIITGIPIKTLALDIISIGAGGGSIARLDDADVLKVGPQSAGSTPGPACYNQGGTEFTVSDANLLLGVLGEKISGIKLDIELAKKAAERLCCTLDINPIELSRGVIRIINNNMASALKNFSLSRGYDPRSFVLIAYGGAGPMHACALAKELGIKKIVIPSQAGSFSAMGIINAPERFDYIKTILKPLNKAMDMIPKIINEFKDDLKGKTNRDFESVKLYPSLDIRFMGQGHEINIPFTDQLEDDFNKRHQDLFGFTVPENPLEVVNVKLVAEITKKHVNLPKYNANSPKIKNKRQVGNLGELGVYSKDFYGYSLQGPCIIEDNTTTVLINNNWQVTLNSNGTMHLESD